MEDDLKFLVYQDYYEKLGALRPQFKEAVKKVCAALYAADFGGREELGFVEENGEIVGVQFYGPDNVTCLEISIRDFGS